MGSQRLLRPTSSVPHGERRSSVSQIHRERVCGLIKRSHLSLLRPKPLPLRFIRGMCTQSSVANPTAPAGTHFKEFAHRVQRGVTTISVVMAILDLLTGFAAHQVSPSAPRHLKGASVFQACNLLSQSLLAPPPQRRIGVSNGVATEIHGSIVRRSQALITICVTSWRSMGLQAHTFNVLEIHHEDPSTIEQHDRP